MVGTTVQNKDTNSALVPQIVYKGCRKWIRVLNTLGNTIFHVYSTFRLVQIYTELFEKVILLSYDCNSIELICEKYIFVAFDFNEKYFELYKIACVEDM